MSNISNIKSILLEYTQAVNYSEITEEDLDIIAERIEREVINPDCKDLIARSFTAMHSSRLFIIEKIKDTTVTITWQLYSGSYDSTTYELDQVLKYIKDGTWSLISLTK